MATREHVGWEEFLRGHVLLQVTGPRPDALLARLIAAGRPFRAARRDARGLWVRMALGDFRRLRPLVRGSGLRVHIAARGGLPFALARAARRPALFAAGAAAALLLAGLSQRVWFVQVLGADRLGEGEVLHVAAAAGLRPGAAKASLDPDRVAAALIADVPALSWAEVTVHGTLATIQVVERALPPPAYEQVGVAGDVVAAHAGIVRGVTVSAGVAVVSPGQRVEPGQVLIRGMIQMPARRGPQGAEGLRSVAVHASGVVVAVQTYQTYAEAPASLEVGVPTGATFVRRVLVVGRLQLVLTGRGRVPWPSYRLSRTELGPLRFRSLVLPGSLLVLRYAEVATHQKALPPAAAAAAAAAAARAFLLRQLPPRARILQERQSTTLLPGGRVGVELWVESEDNIGVFRPTGGQAGGTPTAPGAS